jgi:hypothetical protein
LLVCVDKRLVPAVALGLERRHFGAFEESLKPFVLLVHVVVFELDDVRIRDWMAVASEIDSLAFYVSPVPYGMLCTLPFCSTEHPRLAD